MENHFDKNNTSASANILSAQYVYDLVLESDVLAFCFLFRSLEYVLLATTNTRILAPCLTQFPCFSHFYSFSLKVINCKTRKQ